jgi:hypothetical protein
MAGMVEILDLLALSLTWMTAYAVNRDLIRSQSTCVSNCA